MQPTVLIYHMEPERQTGISNICRSLGIYPVIVSGSLHRKAIGFFCADAGSWQDETAGPAPIDEEMIVMCGFNEQLFNLFLDQLRQAGLRVDLKAVQTETNAHWSAEMLQAELKREREAFRKMSGEPGT